MTSDKVPSRHIASAAHGSSVVVGGDVVAGDKIVAAAADRWGDDLTAYLGTLAGSVIVPDPVRVFADVMPQRQQQIDLGDVLEPFLLRERIGLGLGLGGETYRYVPAHEVRPAAIVGDVDMVPMFAGEILQRHRRALFVGPSGAGKTCLGRCLTRAVALNALGRADRHTERSLGLTPDWLSAVDTPVFVSLRALREQVSEARPASTLWTALEEALVAQGAPQGLVREGAVAGRAVIVLDCDSADPADKVVMKWMCDGLVDLSEQFPNARIVVTCDETSSVVAALTQRGFYATSLAGLDASGFARLTRRWHDVIQSNSAGDGPSGPGQMYGEVVAWQTFRSASLAIVARFTVAAVPGSEALLYESCVTAMLGDTRGASAVYGGATVPSDGAQSARGTRNAAVLLAFRAKEHYGDGLLAKSFALTTLVAVVGGDAWNEAVSLLKFLGRRLGLGITESHVEFEVAGIRDVLAADHVALSDEPGALAAELVCQDPDRWGRVAAWSSELAGPERGLAIVNSMAYAAADLPAEDPRRPHVVAAVADAMCALTPRVHEWRSERAAIVEFALSVLADRDQLATATTQTRARVARAIAVTSQCLGRRRASHCQLVGIAEGEVWCPGPKGEADAAVVRVPHAFSIARFPVSAYEFAEFTAGARLPVVAPDLGLPAVRVSWYDAVAYCEWLTSRALTDGSLHEPGSVFRLPTDPEWQMAMRGGAWLGAERNPMPRRRYPWGDEERPGWANIPSLMPVTHGLLPIGLFAEGTSPFGVEDLVGNVMEWTNTSWGSDELDQPGFSGPYDVGDGREAADAKGFRILRGGSWMFDEGPVQCACRLKADARFDDVGFRVVLGPPLK